MNQSAFFALAAEGIYLFCRWRLPFVDPFILYPVVVICTALLLSDGISILRWVMLTTLIGGLGYFFHTSMFTLEMVLTLFLISLVFQSLYSCLTYQLSKTTAQVLSIGLFLNLMLSPFWLGPFIVYTNQADFVSQLMLFSNPSTLISSSMLEYNYLISDWIYAYSVIGSYEFEFPDKHILQVGYGLLGSTLFVGALFLKKQSLSYPNISPTKN